jgi:hypothetical protein
MTPTLAVAVRWPIDPDEFRVRLSDRAIARLPTVTRQLWGRIVEQPAGSRLRRWIVTRILTSGWAAIDQKDWDYLEAFYDPNVTVIAGEGMVFDWGTAQGWAETRMRLEQTYDAMLSDSRPVEALDFGERFVGVRVNATLTGESSGITLSREMTIVYEIADGGRVLCQIASTNPDEIDEWLTERSH